MDEGQLIEALRSGDVEGVRLEVALRPDLLVSTDSFGYTLLRHAVEFGQTALVRLLAGLGADVNIKFPDGATCLTCAALDPASQSTGVLQALLEVGALIEAPGFSGRTPLQSAAVSGSLGKVRALVEHGAKIDARKSIDGGDTALMEAAWAGHPEVVSYLLERGADASLTNDFGHTALNIAKKAQRGFDPEHEAHLEEAGLGEQLEVFRQAQEEIARQGRHAEVIAILERLKRGRKP